MRTRLLACAALVAAACSIPKSDFKASNDAGAGADASDALAFVVDPTTPLAITEGDHADFHVALNRPPGGTVTATVATTSTKLGLSTQTLTFDDSNYSTAQTVSVQGLKDKDAVDENALVVTVSAPGITTAQVQASVHDTDVLAITTDVTGTVINVDEGNSIEVRVHLTAQPTGDVTITPVLGSGPSSVDPTSLVFTSLDYDQDKVFTFTATIDANTISEDIDLAFRGSDASAEDPAIPDKKYTLHCIDKDVLNIQVTPQAMTINEAGTAGQLQVSLTQQPPTDVTVTLTTETGKATLDKTSLLFHPANYNVAQFVNVSAPADPDTHDDADTIDLTANGIATRTVGVTIKDKDTQKIVTNAPSTLTVSETGSVSFDVWLAFQPSANTTISVASLDSSVATVSPGTLTFTPANYGTHQTVTVSGVHDANLVTNTTTIRLSEATIGMVDVTTNVTDVDGQTIVLSKTTDTIMEPNSDTFTVKLGFDPGGTVTLNVASSDTGALTVTPATLTFNSSNYANPQTVTMSAVKDPDANDEDVTVNVTGAGASAQQVMVHIKDSDTLAMAVSPALPLSVNEGGFVTMKVHLTAQPNGNVTVSANLGAGPVSVTPAMVTFTPANYATDQTFQFNGDQDANTTNEDVSLTYHASVAGIPDVTGTIHTIDDDVLNIKLNTTSMTLTEEGAAGTLQVSLSAQPAATTTVNLMASNGKITLSTTALQFTTSNWSQPQAVTVNAPADPDTQNDTSVITVSAIGLTSQTVNVSIIDNDTQALMTDAPSTLNLSENGTATFHIWLAYQPSGTMTINIASLNGNVATVSPSFYNFDASNYGTHQTVTVTGVHDSNLVTDQTTVRLSEASLGNKDIPVAVADIDSQKIVLSKTSTTITEGQSDTFTVKLAYDPGGTVNLSLSSTNATALPVSPTTMTFSSANYSTPQTATISAPVDKNTISESATITVSGASAPDATVAASVTDQTVIVTYGWPTPFSMFTSGGTGAVIAYQVQVTTGTTLDQVGMYSNSATGDFRMAVYADQSNRPGALVASFGTKQNVVAGNNLFDLTDKPLAVGTYWIALRAADATFIGQHPTAQGYMCSANLNDTDPWPANWIGSLSGSTSCQNLNLLNIWMTTYHQ